jgi:hypothetical protein
MRVTTVSWLALVTSLPLISSKKSPFLYTHNMHTKYIPRA